LRTALDNDGYYVAQRPQQTGDAGPVRIPAEALDALVAGIVHLGERTLSGLAHTHPRAGARVRACDPGAHQCSAISKFKARLHRDYCANERSITCLVLQIADKGPIDFSTIQWQAF
jgi:hypothetical protein